MSISPQSDLAVKSDGECLSVLRLISELVRQDAYAEAILDAKTGKWSYRKRIKPLDEAVLHQHLNGGPPVGIYVLKQGASRTSLLIFDLDDHSGDLGWETVCAVAIRLRDAAARHGLHLWGVRSGGGAGIHLVAHWGDPQPGDRVRHLARAILDEVGHQEGSGGLADKQVEIFPKQNGISGDDFGSLIALPFGRRSVPLDAAMQAAEHPGEWVSSEPPRPLEKTAKAKRKKAVWSPEEIGRLEAALSVLSADDYDMWVRYGQALKHDLGEAGWPVWERWSGSSEKRPDERELRRKWDSLDRSNTDNPITVATIFRDAKEAGWVDPDSITVMDGFRHEAAEQAMAKLVEAGTEIYQRSGALVQVVRLPAKDSDQRLTYVPSIVALTKPILASEMAKAAVWLRPGRGSRLVRIEPDRDVVDKVMDLLGQWPFAPLHGIISTPTMRPDGTLLTAPGYDVQTGYVMFDPPLMPPIPEHPTRDDALAALGVLDGLLTEFPFVSEVDKSVALSGFLTTVLRAAVDVVPIHVFDAPTPGTGKSYLANLPARLATGARAAAITLTARDQEENEKRLSAAAVAGDPIIFIDNCSHPNWGAFLNSVVSEQQVKIRILGSFRLPTVNNTFSVFIAGNNVEIGADMVRRTIKCRLDANVERPEAREFHGDPEAEIIRNRGRYVAAVLTIARAYVAAGFPDRLSRPGFESWSKFVRSPLVWLGRADPIESVKDLVVDDPVRLARAEVFEEMAKAGLLGYPVKTGDIIKQAEEHGGLQAALERVAKARDGDGGVDLARFGNWLNRQADQMAGGYKLGKDRGDKKRPRWVLVETEPHDQQDAAADAPKGTLRLVGEAAKAAAARETRF